MSKSKDEPEEGLRDKIKFAIVSFLLTGLVGSWVTACWSNLQARAQQERVRQEKVLDQRYAILESLTKSIAETGAAASDIALLGFWDWTSCTRPVEVSARDSAWTESSRVWRVDSRILRMKIGLYFGDAEAGGQFEEIIGLRRQMGQKVRTLIEASQGGCSTSLEIRRNLAGEINELVNRLDRKSNSLAERLGHKVAR